MGRLESYNAVAAAILGQSEVFISLKQQLPYIPKQRLYTLTASECLQYQRQLLVHTSH